jgi:membrane protease subunit HflC
MRRHLTILIAAVVVVTVLLAYMVTFQVRYDEVAMVQTFGSVEPPATDDAGRVKRNAAGQVAHPGSLVFEPGLYFRWPWPIQKITSYSSKLHLLETDLHQVETRDGRLIVVKSYLTWRVTNPHALSNTAGGVAAAEDKLQTWMSNLGGLIGEKYAFRDLVNNDPEQLKRDELEKAFLDWLRQRLARNQASYGVAIEQFGIRRLLLPKDVTPEVLDRMAKTRQAMAESARSEGQARALSITSKAESQKQQILAFAKRQAQALRTAGDRQAAQYYDAFRKNEEFAVFLRKIEALEKILPKNSTFILDAKTMDPFNLLDAGATDQLKAVEGADDNNAQQPEQANQTDRGE